MFSLNVAPAEPRDCQARMCCFASSPDVLGLTIARRCPFEIRQSRFDWKDPFMEKRAKHQRHRVDYSKPFLAHQSARPDCGRCTHNGQLAKASTLQKSESSEKAVTRRTRNQCDHQKYLGVQTIGTSNQMYPTKLMILEESAVIEIEPLRELIAQSRSVHEIALVREITTRDVIPDALLANPMKTKVLPEHDERPPTQPRGVRVVSRSGVAPSPFCFTRFFKHLTPRLPDAFQTTTKVVLWSPAGPGCLKSQG